MNTEQNGSKAGTPSPVRLGSRRDWMTDEAFVTGYAVEHLPDGEAFVKGTGEDATGCCLGCQHRRFAQESVEPSDGDWCYLVHGIGGEDRWGECPALSANNSISLKNP